MARKIPGLIVSILIAATAVSAAAPEPEELVDRIIAAVGGEAFAELGVLQLEVTEEQTRNDGTASTKTYDLWVHTSNLHNARMELAGDVVVACGGGEGWSSKAGVLDDRPQTPGMAKRTLNQTLFPLLLPYTLKMENVWLKEVAETTWEGREAWELQIPFAKGFFVNPVLATAWRIVVAKDDASILAVDFLPPVEYRDVEPMGVRYRILKYEDVNGAKVPSWILAVGINVEGHESGATRVTKIKPTVYGPWNPRLFINPARLEELEGE